MNSGDLNPAILRRLTYCVILCASCAAVDASEVRLWTDAAGKLQVEAELMDFDNGNVWLKVPYGRRLHVPLKQLSQADQEFVVKLWAQRRVMTKQEADADPEAVRYGPARELCKLANRAIGASSGIAPSRRAPGLFWTHNDKGNDPRLYLFDKQGRDLGSCALAGVDAFDWEDVASFSWQGKSYLLVADTGNNGLNAPVHMLHLVEEPPVNPQQKLAAKEVPVLETIHFSFSDDFRDCEAMAVDPTDRSIVLVSKDRGLGGHVYVLAWPTPLDPNKPYVAKLIATLKLPPATGMDISPDGRRAVVVSYENAFEFRRQEKEGWAQAFTRPPREIAMPRREQGESICYGPDGKTLYLTSEQLPTPLWEVPAAK